MSFSLSLSHMSFPLLMIVILRNLCISLIFPFSLICKDSDVVEYFLHFDRTDNFSVSSHILSILHVFPHPSMIPRKAITAIVENEITIALQPACIALHATTSKCKPNNTRNRPICPRSSRSFPSPCQVRRAVVTIGGFRRCWSLGTRDCLID